MDAASSFAHRLHRASQVADAYFTAAANAEITSRQLVLLDIISHSPGCSQTHLVSNSGIDRSTVADLVLRLVRVGLVRRRRSPSDARTYELKLTERGEMALKEGLKAASITDTVFTKALIGRAEQLVELLEIIAALPNPPRDLGG